MKSPEGERKEIAESEVIEALRREPFKRLGDCETYVDWTRQEEQRNERLTEADARVMANFELILKGARIAKSAGMHASALHGYEDALEYAENILKDESIIATIRKEMAGLETIGT